MPPPAETHRTATAPRMVFLDLLRIFAFVSVLLGHKFATPVAALASDATASGLARSFAAALLALIHGGGVGVVVFFLVSGYVITHVLQREQALEFAIKRVFRIYPLYMTAVLIEYGVLSFLDKQPDPAELLPHLLLIGDLFATPYALHGVEWTLRVEVVFYAFMGIGRWAQGRAGRHWPQAWGWRPWLWLGVLLCAGLAPIPAGDVWSRGYLTLYAPCLLLGAMWQLRATQRVTWAELLLFHGVVLGLHVLQLMRYQPQWLGAALVPLALGVFLLLWWPRTQLPQSRWIRHVSDLTFAVYVFHNWMFEVAGMVLAHAGLAVAPAKLQALLLLLLFCWAMGRLVEQPGIRLGQALARRFG